MTRQTFIAAITLALLAGGAHAGDKFYDVTITNITRSQSFTPIAVVTHKEQISLFRPGAPAIAEIAELAESGNLAPLVSLAASLPDLVGPIANSNGLLAPGEKTTVRVRRESKFDRISVVAMLIPTNDTFVAINTVEAPKGKQVLHLNAIAYDAGSEHNDENCANIPGPVCGGAGSSNEGGEGYVHVSGGIKGIDSLDPVDFDWRNPVATVSIVRAKD